MNQSLIGGPARGAELLALALETGKPWVQIRGWDEMVDHDRPVCTLDPKVVEMLLLDGADPNEKVTWSSTSKESLGTPWQMFLWSLQAKYPKGEPPEQVLLIVEALVQGGARCSSSTETTTLEMLYGSVETQRLLKLRKHGKSKQGDSSASGWKFRWWSAS